MRIFLLFLYRMAVVSTVVISHDLTTALSIDPVCRRRFGKWTVDSYLWQFWESQPSVRYVAMEMDQYRFYDADMQLIVEWPTLTSQHRDQIENSLGLICQMYQVNA